MLATRAVRTREQGLQLAMSTHCSKEVIDLRRDGFARYNRMPIDRFDKVGTSTHIMAVSSGRDRDMEVLMAAGRVTRGGRHTSPIQESTNRTSVLPWGPQFAEFTFGVTRMEFRRKKLFDLLRATSVVHASRLRLQGLTLIVQASVPEDQDSAGGFDDMVVDPADSLLRLGFKEVHGEGVVVNGADRPLRMRSFLHDLRPRNVEKARRTMLMVHAAFCDVPSGHSPFIWEGPLVTSAGTI